MFSQQFRDFSFLLFLLLLSLVLVYAYVTETRRATRIFDQEQNPANLGDGYFVSCLCQLMFITKWLKRTQLMLLYDAALYPTTSRVL